MSAVGKESDLFPSLYTACFLLATVRFLNDNLEGIPYR